VLKECIVGAIEARFGPLKEASPKRPNSPVPTAANASEFNGKNASYRSHYLVALSMQGGVDHGLLR
jgi:hypothetical protein